MSAQRRAGLECTLTTPAAPYPPGYTLEVSADLAAWLEGAVTRPGPDKNSPQSAVDMTGPLGLALLCAWGRSALCAFLREQWRQPRGEESQRGSRFSLGSSPSLQGPYLPAPMGSPSFKAPWRRA